MPSPATSTPQRARWTTALRAHVRRWLMASDYALRGFGLRIEQVIRPTRPVVRLAGEPKRILIVDDLLPDPLFGAGYPRAAAIVRSLSAAGHAVELYPMHASAIECTRVAAAFDGNVRFHRGRGAHGLRRLLWRGGDRFDALFVSRPAPMAALLAARWSRAGDVPVIYDAEAVLAPRDQRRLTLIGTPWTDPEYRAALATEIALTHSAQAVTAVGPMDAELIRSATDKPVIVLPHSVDVRRVAPGPAGRADLLFVGRLTGAAAQSPNVDSLLWFITEVIPRLDRLAGTDYRLHVSGRVDAPELSRLGSDRVIFHGVVKDLEPLYDRCRVFVAPTRYAAGIPLKVIEAMGQGIPSVATPLLAQQLGTRPEALHTGANAEAFAAACARLYADDATWLTAQRAGFDHIEREASPAMFDRALADLFGQFGITGPGGARA